MNRFFTVRKTGETITKLFTSKEIYGLRTCTKFISSFQKDTSKNDYKVSHKSRWQSNSQILANSGLPTNSVKSAVSQCTSFHTSCTKLQEAVAEKSVKEEHQFQADTRMLLDIVARSLYSDKEVFIRELVSNASDALEKLRCLTIQETSSDAQSAPLKISIETDKYAKTLTFIDTGIGMRKEELINNLGTIARSGSKEFLQEFQKGGADPHNIIGQFGVGFYSTFMVADKVEVYTKSHHEDSAGFCWVSDGSGKYTIEEHAGLPVGTKIVCHLKTDNREFSDEQTVKTILTKYSSFVGFPIELNGTQANTLEPLWLKDPKQVSTDEHNEFYKFVGASYDTPRFTLHFQTDAPVNLRCLLYFPEGKPGLFDVNKEGDVSVSLYSRRVLIQSKVDSLLPKWLKFLKGVVDSEDIPLNLSREMLQDSALIRKLKTMIQNRVVRFLVDKARKDPESYNKFLADYGIFLKEGILSSPEQMEKEEIAKLVLYESSKFPPGEMTSLATYVARMPDTQKEIYYLATPSRKLAEASPYFEAMKKKDVEILFCYETYDEVVLMQLRQFNQKNILSVEKEVRQSKEKVDFDAGGVGLQRAEVNDLLDWIKSILPGKCFHVKATPHLESHPCIVTVEDMGAARHFVRTQFAQMPEDTRYSLLQPQLEINPSHPIILKLNKLRIENKELSELLVKQLFSNAMVTAGLIDDPRNVLTNMNQLLELALEKH